MTRRIPPASSSTPRLYSCAANPGATARAALQSRRCAAPADCADCGGDTGRRRRCASTRPKSTQRPSRQRARFSRRPPATRRGSSWSTARVCASTSRSQRRCAPSTRPSSSISGRSSRRGSRSTGARPPCSTRWCRPTQRYDARLGFAPVYRSNGMDLLVDDTLWPLLELPRDIDVVDSTSVPWALKRPLFWLAEVQRHLDRAGGGRAVYLTKREPGDKEDAACHRDWERFRAEVDRDDRIEVRVRSSLDDVVQLLNRTRFLFHPSTSEFAPRAVIEGALLRRARRRRRLRLGGDDLDQRRGARAPPRPYGARRPACARGRGHPAVADDTRAARGPRRLPRRARASRQPGACRRSRCSRASGSTSPPT